MELTKNKLIVFAIGFTIGFTLSMVSCAQEKPLLPHKDDVPHKVYPLKYKFKKLKKPIVVAVIDTGIDSSLMNSKFLCKQGHKDFTGKGLEDNHGHGSHVAGLIQQYAIDVIFDKSPSVESQERVKYTDAPYCQVILKYYDPKQLFPDNLEQEIKALEYAINIKVDIINFSGGGTEKSAKEEKLIKKALDMGIKIVVAAGNEKSNIDKRPYYPAALDSRLYVVGNLSDSDVRAPSSNFGSKVNSWELGTNRLSFMSKATYGLLTGTSQATAVKTGKLVREMLINSAP